MLASPFKTQFPPVERRPLQTHADPRGALTELFRNEWLPTAAPVQWNAVRSAPGALRGVHLHLGRFDHLIVIDGHMQLGLSDLRAGSHGYGTGQCWDLLGGPRELVSIPPGVAHGFYFPLPTLFVYALTTPWDAVSDELGCRWDDPGLRIPWRPVDPVLSKRDEDAGPLRELIDEIAARARR